MFAQNISHNSWYLLFLNQYSLQYNWITPIIYAECCIDLGDRLAWKSPSQDKFSKTKTMVKPPNLFRSL